MSDFSFYRFFEQWLSILLVCVKKDISSLFLGPQILKPIKSTPLLKPITNHCILFTVLLLVQQQVRVYKIPLLFFQILSRLFFRIQAALFGTTNWSCLQYSTYQSKQLDPVFSNVRSRQLYRSDSTFKFHCLIRWHNLNRTENVRYRSSSTSNCCIELSSSSKWEFVPFVFQFTSSNRCTTNGQ